MNRRTYGGKTGKRSVSGGKFRSGYASAPFPSRNAEHQQYNKCKPIIVLKNLNQFKTCVNLHQTKGEKYTLTKVIFCPTNGGYLRNSNNSFVLDDFSFIILVKLSA